MCCDCHFQSEYNGNILGSVSVIDGDKKTGSPLYSFSKIIERISPEKGSPDRTPYTLRAVRRNMRDWLHRQYLYSSSNYDLFVFVATELVATDSTYSWVKIWRRTFKMSSKLSKENRIRSTYRLVSWRNNSEQQWKVIMRTRRKDWCLYGSLSLTKRMRF